MGRACLPRVSCSIGNRRLIVTLLIGRPFRPQPLAAIKNKGTVKCLFEKPKCAVQLGIYRISELYLYTIIFHHLKSMTGNKQIIYIERKYTRTSLTCITL